MKTRLFIPALIILLISQTAFTQSNRISILVPTAEKEAGYIWQQMQDLPFFIENGYDLVLPEGELMEELKEKGFKATLDENDFLRFKDFFKKEIYDATNYQKGYDKIAVQLDLINQLNDELIGLDYDWKFKSFQKYEVILTKYGPGGSYNPDTGSIILYTNSNGEFKGYPNPINTIIHELVHIGIEESLIQKYQVPHTMKERIVDLVVFILFADELPDYRIQDMGDYRIDPYLNSEDDILKLDQIIQSISKD